VGTFGSDKPTRRLTPRQRRFVDEYLVDLNATQAAIRAGYSPRTARAIGSENLTKPDIRAAIDQAGADRAARCRVTADEVLAELKLIAFSDIRDVGFGPDGRLTAASPEAARAVATTSWARREGPRGTYLHSMVRLWDKPTAIRLLMLHLGMLAPRPPLEVFLAHLPDALADRLRAAIIRAAGPPADPAGRRGAERLDP
jgi:phage terminase small subunit